MCRFVFVLQRKGINVRQRLLAFHRQFYFAEAMKLVILDPVKTLDELQICAERCFAAVPTRTMQHRHLQADHDDENDILTSSSKPAPSPPSKRKTKQQPQKQQQAPLPSNNAVAAGSGNSDRVSHPTLGALYKGKIPASWGWLMHTAGWIKAQRETRALWDSSPAPTPSLLAQQLQQAVPRPGSSKPKSSKQGSKKTGVTSSSPPPADSTGAGLAALAPLSAGPDFAEAGCPYASGERCQGYMFLVVPVKEVHRLVISWSLPSLDALWRVKPVDWVEHVIGHEGPGM